MKEIDASIDRGEGGEEKEKERKEKESVYTEIFSILNKNGLGKGKTDLKTILYTHHSFNKQYQSYQIFIKTLNNHLINILSILYSILLSFYLLFLFK